MTNTTEKLATREIEDTVFGYISRQEEECLEDPSKINKLLETEFQKMRKQKLIEIASKPLNEFFKRIDLPFQEVFALSCIYCSIDGKEKTDEELIRDMYKSNPERRHFTVEDLYKVLNAKADIIFGNRMAVRIDILLKIISEHTIKYLQEKYPNVPEKRLVQIAKKLLNGKILQEYNKYKKIRNSY
jgi:hypothetical protein